MESVIEEVRAYEQATHVVLTGGEPLIHKESIDLLERRIDLEALSRMIDTYEMQLKFVVTDPSDLPEINDLVRQVREATTTTMSNDDMSLMPERMTRDQLDGTRSEVAELAMEHGYRYTPRLHVDLWNDAPGT